MSSMSTTAEERIDQLIKELEDDDPALFDLMSAIQRECDGKTVMVSLSTENIVQRTSALQRALSGFKKKSYSGVYIHQLFAIAQDNENGLLLAEEDKVSEFFKVLLGSDSEVFSLVLGCGKVSEENIKLCKSLLTTNTSLQELAIHSISEEPLLGIIADVVEKNNTIVTLQVSDHFMDIEEMIPFSEALKKNNTLEKLTLVAEHGLDDECLIQLSQSVQINKSLQQLRLKGGSGKDCFTSFSDILNSKGNLEIFQSEIQSKYCAENVKVAFVRAHSKSNLQEIRFSNRILNDRLVRELALHFPKSMKLLQITQVKLTQESMEILSTNLPKFELTGLSLEDCSLSFPAAAGIGDIIKNCKKLTFLSIEKNMVTKEMLEVLKEALLQNESISRFSFGKGRKLIPDEEMVFEFLSFLLRYLHLSSIICHQVVTFSSESAFKMIREDIRQNKSVISLSFLGLDEKKGKHADQIIEACREALLENETLCQFVCGQVVSDAINMELAPNVQKTQSRIKRLIYTLVSRELRKSSLKSLADEVNLVRLVWKYASGWLFVHLFGDSSSMLNDIIMSD
jgi:hypothetical protein